MYGIKQLTTGDWPALWLAFRAPLIGGALALVLALVARWRRSALLFAATGGAGIAVGWALIAGIPTTFLPPKDMAARLPAIATVSGLLALLTAWLAPQRGRWPCLILLAVASGWWLAGVPRAVAEFTPVVLLAGGLVAWHGLAARQLGRGGHGRLVLAALTFALALWVARAPATWLLLALAPALASLALLLVPAAELALLPVAIDLAAVMAATLLATGRLPRGLGALDVAVVAPVLAVLVAPRLRLSPLLGGALAGAIAVGATWLAQMWLG